MFSVEAGSHSRKEPFAHGGASQLGRYSKDEGDGFKPRFFEWRVDKPIFIYVSKDQMGEYRFRQYLDVILRQEDFGYFRIFAVSELTVSTSGKSFKLEISDLKQLAVIASQKKGSVTSSESESVN